MRRVIPLPVAVLVAMVALAGCAQKTDRFSETSSDSLLASNPVEQPPGDLAPQTEYQEPEPVKTSPPPAARPRPSQSAPRPRTPSEEPVERGVKLEAGTPIEVQVTTQISSETSSPGDTWTGEVKEAVVVGNTVAIPAGSTVTGVVSGVSPAERGSRAHLVLSVRSVNVNGKSMSVSAGTDSIIAGSTRARNLGAIAGSAAAGALIGKAVGGSGKGAVIGGLIGGAAATGAVAKSKGYQVVIKEGTNLTFTVNQTVRMRS